MNVLESNLALLSTIPDDRQEEIQNYLVLNFCKENPYRPLDRNEILSELAESRHYYNCGGGEDFDKVLDELAKKFDL